MVRGRGRVLHGQAKEDETLSCGVTELRRVRSGGLRWKGGAWKDGGEDGPERKPRSKGREGTCERMEAACSDPGYGEQMPVPERRTSLTGRRRRRDREDPERGGRRESEGGPEGRLRKRRTRVRGMAGRDPSPEREADRTGRRRRGIGRKLMRGGRRESAGRPGGEAGTAPREVAGEYAGERQRRSGPGPATPSPARRDGIGPGVGGLSRSSRIPRGRDGMRPTGGPKMRLGPGH